GLVAMARSHIAVVAGGLEAFLETDGIPTCQYYRQFLSALSPASHSPRCLGCCQAARCICITASIGVLLLPRFVMSLAAWSFCRPRLFQQSRTLACSTTSRPSLHCGAHPNDWRRPRPGAHGRPWSTWRALAKLASSLPVAA